MRNFKKSSRSWRSMLVFTLAAAVAAAVGLTGSGGKVADAASYETAPAYGVVQEGLTRAEADRLAAAFGIRGGLQPNGAFAYVDAARFANVPTTKGVEGKDEQGNPTFAEALDLRAISAIRPIPNDRALAGADKLIAVHGPGPDFAARPMLSHSELTLADSEGRPGMKRALDTTVSFQLTLGGLPTTGQGSKLRITFAPDGAVSQLSNTLRKVERLGEVAIISQERAIAGCQALYPSDVKQGTPTLGYYLPELTAVDASGKGSVQTLLPTYTCNPIGGEVAQAHRLLPAVPGSEPQAKVVATKAGTEISAKAFADGGTPPYSFSWSSSTTVIPAGANGGTAVKYLSRPRTRAVEVVSLQVTDANGITSTASVPLPFDGTHTGETVPGGGGFGNLGLGVGIEQTVDEWQCAQDSAIGFKSVMQSQAVPVKFDFRGYSAYEKDFKRGSLGGWDSSYVDAVDMQWYTGHGSSSGFTFKSSVDDTKIVPADARWGDSDLEWLQLESCQVLKDTTGTHDYFGRWGPTMDGLHMLNGFHTNASCVNGGTGGTFAAYLFPYKVFGITVRPALTVRKAWANMAIDKEPSGRIYRSMGPIGPGWVTNISDHFWGQGSVGPDISAAAKIGYWSITGTV